MSKDSTPTWVFERRGKKQKAVGDYVPGQIIKSRKHDEFDILAREGGQNTKNQPKYDEKIKPVKVEIKLIELTGNYIKEYLEALNWKIFSEHLIATSKIRKQSNISIQLNKAIKDLTNVRESFFILNIEDSNTIGLTGPEGDDVVEKPNFFSLCKADFFSEDKAKSSRGGSYGVGKSILWKCSKFSTVLFSSLLDEDKNNQTKEGLRIFGRTELASHKIGNKQYMGHGYFGIPSLEKEIDYEYKIAQSIWNKNDLAEKLYISRDREKGTGTTVSVVGFQENLSSLGYDGNEILIGLKEKFEKYFWPSLALKTKTLDLSFVYQRNNKVRTEFEDDLNVNCEKWKPFIDAANSKIENTVQIANAPGLISKRAFSIRIPPRKIEIPEIKEKIKGHTNAKVELSLKRESKSLNIHEESNRIALIRGFGMVVDYHRPDREPLSSDMPYFGVVKTGKLNGEKVEDIVSEIFFKDLEPALHDRWDKKTDGLKNKYSGYADTVDDFYSRIDENLMEMCGEEEAESDEGPQILSDMLQMGFKGKSNEVKISSEEIRAQAIDSFKWAVSGRIKISDYPKSNGNNKDKSWKVGFGFSVKEESSRGDKVPFSKIEILDEGVEITEENNSVKAKVTNIKNFAFKGELDLKSIIQRQNPKLCAINFYTS